MLGLGSIAWFPRIPAGGFTMFMTSSVRRPALSLAVTDRMAEGKALRKLTPRRSLATFQPASERDPVAILEAENATRVAQLVGLRHERMAESAFTFFRGGAAIMASDLATAPRSGIDVQLCGDAHLMNFGLFASRERRLVFDINDFDETDRGPFEWDLKRLAASFVVAGRALGYTPYEQELAVLDALGGYSTAMREFASWRNLDVWYSHFDVQAIFDHLRATIPKSAKKRVPDLIARAQRKDAMRALRKLTEETPDGLRIKSDPPIVVRLDESGHGILYTEEHLGQMVRDYVDSLPNDRHALLAQYEMIDTARKVVGVGSVGTRCFITLLTGRDDTDPLFLQVKQAEPSALEPYVGSRRYENHGERVVQGQRLIQATPDIFLGWTRSMGTDGNVRDFYLRQLHDQKASVILENLDLDLLRAYAKVCGWALARAHARSGDRILLAGYLGQSQVFEQAMTAFAFTYADQNEADHRALLDAMASGRVAGTPSPAPLD